MGRISAIAGFLLLFSAAEGQVPVGSWTDHLICNSANSLAIGSGNIYASTGSSIIVYNKRYSELRKLSRVHGLSETGISSIAWSGENSILVIAYKNTNIDIVSNSTIFNIPDILNKYIPGNKRINRIRTSGNFAYLASGFGIVVTDLVRREIRDTWRPGPDAGDNEVFDIAFGDGKVYAATENGIWYADVAVPGLSFFGNWNRINDLPSPEVRYTHIIFSGGTLYVNESGTDSSGDAVYAAGNGFRLLQYTQGTKNTSFDHAPGGFTVSSPGAVRLYDNPGILTKTISSYGWGAPDISQGIIEDGTLWLADISYGLIRGENITNFTNLVLPGPVTNNVVSIASGNGRTIICGGGTDNNWNPLGRSFRVSVHENYNFSGIVSATAQDAMRSVPVPGSPNRIFVSTWGDGLFEYQNTNLINHYNSYNSPLQPAVPGTGSVRICGLAMDKQGNLWMTQTGGTGNLKALKPNGSWIVNPLTIDAPVTGDIIITSAGQKWIILPGGHGLFVLDDNNTPETFTDDRYKKFTPKDPEDRIFSSVFSIAEDLDGVIWIGTDQGPLLYYDAGKIFDDDPRAFRIRIPRNDGTGLADYLLGTETITSIAVDGGNRKWLGTSGSGAYLVSGEGSELIRHFTKTNSPLLSDSIATLAVDQRSGEVWFGTSEGVISFRGEATAGAESFDNVYAFPNPVRESFSGNVTITGVTRDSQIKITDISGNLVNEMRSEGGQASWDLTTYNGRRVTTGVYLIFGASSDGRQSFVTKILVIR